MANTHHKPDGLLSTQISGPSVPLLTTAEAKRYMPGVDFADDDALIADLVEAATEQVDAKWGELGLALVTQRWQITLPVWPARNHINFPVTPVQQVTSITYYDADNVEQTLSPDVYRLIVDTEDAYIELLDGQSFPTVYNRPDAIAIQYDAGFGDLGSDVPFGIRKAVAALVNYWYDNPSAVTEKGGQEMPIGVRSLLMKYRITRGHI